MRAVQWTDEARFDLRDIVGYLTDRNPRAALRIEAAIFDTVDLLPENPFIYRAGRIPGTREAVMHPNYIVIYRVTDAAIVVAAVMHARQRYP